MWFKGAAQWWCAKGHVVSEKRKEVFFQRKVKFDSKQNRLPAADKWKIVRLNPFVDIHFTQTYTVKGHMFEKFLYWAKNIYICTCIYMYVSYILITVCYRFTKVLGSRKDIWVWKSGSIDSVLEIQSCSLGLKKCLSVDPFVAHVGTIVGLEVLSWLMIRSSLQPHNNEH